MDKKNTPEVKLGQYKGLAVTRHVRPVTDKTVDIELVHQARMHAVYHPTTAPAKRGFRGELRFRYNRYGSSSKHSSRKGRRTSGW